MVSPGSGAQDCIGIIANPVSARDVRRIVANASSLQISERVNIVLRVLSTVRSFGVKRVLMMPDRAGIRAMLVRHLNRERNLHHVFPEVEFLDINAASTVDDTILAARMMGEAGVRAVVVLGGDGTHRAVIKGCSTVPIAGLSTGTNNAFPEMREPTIAAMAERQVALVPTMVNLETFPEIAASGEAKFPTYAAHMRDLHARRFETMAKAADAGVPIYAGTDAGGSLAHGLIPDEVALLAKVGGAEFALGAASWRARDWLGRDALGEGASADLVVFASDPRKNLAVVREPLFVILRGRVVRG